MNKMELAAYLASLSTLLKDQDASGVNLRSKRLGREFERNWKKLEEEIEDETGTIEEHDGTDEAGASGEGR